MDLTKDIEIDDIYINEKKIKYLDSSGLDYYILFKEMMTNIYNHADTYNYNKSNYFLYCINSSESHNVFIQHANIIKLKEIYNCAEHIAINLYEIFKNLNIYLPINDIALSINIIIENYISIMAKIKKGYIIDPIITKIDKNGKIHIIDGFHRTIIKKICNFKKIKIIIANRESNNSKQNIFS